MQALPPKKRGGQVSAKVAPLLYKGKDFKLVVGTLLQPVRVPFEFGTIDNNPSATRINIVYEVTDPLLQAFFNALDETIIGILTERCQDLFKKPARKIKFVGVSCLPSQAHRLASRPLNRKL